MHLEKGVDVAVASEVIYHREEIMLENTLKGDNFLELPDQVMINSRHNIYKQRTVSFDEVTLIEMPINTKLLGGKNYILVFGDSIISEQLPPENIISFSDVERCVVEDKKTINIDAPSVLVSRYGIMTWGHWLVHLLPRVLAAEKKWPGRFNYILPQDIFNGTSPRNVWNSILETIYLAGVSKDRITAARYDVNYQFREIHMVVGIVTNGAVHPRILELLRALSRGKSPLAYYSQPARRIALLRTDSRRRNIINLSPVVRLLKDFDFEFAELSKIPVFEQINLFSSASLIVGVLASELAGIVFARSGTTIISLAPAGYRNSFYFPIMQFFKCAYYDIRGLPDPNINPNDTYANFHIDQNILESVLIEATKKDRKLIEISKSLEKDLKLQEEITETPSHKKDSKNKMNRKKLSMEGKLISARILTKKKSAEEEKVSTGSFFSVRDAKEVFDYASVMEENSAIEVIFRNFPDKETFEEISIFLKHHNVLKFISDGGDLVSTSVAFSRSPSCFDLKGASPSTVNIAQSHFDFTHPILGLIESVAPRTSGAAFDIEKIVAAASILPDDSTKITAGISYWVEMMKGYRSYQTDGMVSINNYYLVFLKNLLESTNFDRVLLQRMQNDEESIKRIKSRFDDIDKLSRSDFNLASTEPITIFNPNPIKGRYLIVKSSLRNKMYSDLIDGYHRVFWAKFFGVRKLKARFILNAL